MRLAIREIGWPDRSRRAESGQQQIDQRRQGSPDTDENQDVVRPEVVLEIEDGVMGLAGHGETLEQHALGLCELTHIRPGFFGRATPRRDSTPSNQRTARCRRRSSREPAEVTSLSFKSPRYCVGHTADIPKRHVHAVARSASFHSSDNRIKGGLRPRRYGVSSPFAVLDGLCRLVLKGRSQEYDFSAVFGPSL